MASRHTAEPLPAPHANVLDTFLFWDFGASGGPHLDVLLYNQKSILMLAQDIRLIQSQIPHGSATIAAEAGLGIGGFASEVTDILNDASLCNILIGMLEKWMSEDPKSNKVALTRANSHIDQLANSMFAHFKDKLSNYWDRTDVQFDDDDADDDQIYKKLIRCLKAVEQDQESKNELHVKIAKQAKKEKADKGKRPADSAPGTPSAAGAAGASLTGSKQTKRKKTTHTGARGGASGSRNISRASSAVPDVIVTGAGTGGDATAEAEVESDDGMDEASYDDIFGFAAQRANQQNLHAAMRRHASVLRVSSMINEAIEKGDWAKLQESKAALDEAKEEVATRCLARLYLD